MKMTGYWANQLIAIRPLVTCSMRVALMQTKPAVGVVEAATPWRAWFSARIHLDGWTATAMVVLGIWRMIPFVTWAVAAMLVWALYLRIVVSVVEATAILRAR